MPSEAIFLSTERVTLRAITAQDAPYFLELDQDPAVMLFINGGRPSTPDEAQRAIERVMKIQSSTQGKFGLWLAFDRSRNYLGWFLFRPDKKHPDDHQVIELGYRLKKQYWGQGLATEVSRALVDLGFNEYQVNRIFAIAMKGNLASQAVMKKLGMVWECDYQETDFPGEDQSAVRYSMPRRAE